MKLQPYPVYKDSGVAWLGKVPEHWQVVPLCSIAEPKKIVGKQDRELLSVYLHQGVIRFSDAQEKRTNVTSEDLSKYQAVDPGDFVLNNQQAWRGSVGVSRYSGIVSPAYLVLSLDSSIDSDYADMIFRDRSMVGQYLVSSKGVGSIQRNLYWPYLKRALTLLPSSEEQAIIVRFLNHADQRIRRYIRAKQKLIKLLQEQKQAIIHRAVTRGLDPNVRLKPSGVEWLGDIPTHWKVRKLATLGPFLKGRGIARTDIVETGLPAITYGDIYTQYDVEAKALIKFTTPEVAAGSFEIRGGDLLFTASGETIEDIGKTILYSCDKPAYAGGDIIILRLDEGHGLYLSYFLNSKLGVRQKSSFGRGDIIVHISATKLKQVIVPLPPQSEQVLITDFLNQASANIEDAIERAKREISLLREYRIRLVADVVTGKFDVRDAVSQLPEELEELELIDEVDDIADSGGNEVDDFEEELEEAVI